MHRSLNSFLQSRDEQQEDEDGDQHQLQDEDFDDDEGDLNNGKPVGDGGQATSGSSVQKFAINLGMVLAGSLTTLFGLFIDQRVPLARGGEQ